MSGPELTPFAVVSLKCPNPGRGWQSAMTRVRFKSAAAFPRRKEAVRRTAAQSQNMLQFGRRAGKIADTAESHSFSLSRRLAATAIAGQTAHYHGASNTQVVEVCPFAERGIASYSFTTRTNRFAPPLRQTPVTGHISPVLRIIDIGIGPKCRGTGERMSLHFVCDARERHVHAYPSPVLGGMQGRIPRPCFVMVAGGSHISSTHEEQRLNQIT